MKAKVSIITFLICAFAFTSHSQARCIDGSNKPLSFYPIDSTNAKILIADESWLTYSKTAARIMTYSESVFKDISLKFGEEFKRISILYKKDRNGPYKEYNIYLSKETATNLINWAKTNL